MNLHEIVDAVEQSGAFPRLRKTMLHPRSGEEKAPLLLVTFDEGPKPHRDQLTERLRPTLSKIPFRVGTVFDLTDGDLRLAVIHLRPIGGP